MGLAFALPANAGLIITPTFDASITSDTNASAIMATIETAIAFYEATFSNAININIGFTEMSSGLGENSSYVSQLSYKSFVNALKAGSSGDSTDTTALASLSTGNNNPVTGTSLMTIKTADLKALGYSSYIPSSQIDGTVSLNTSVTNAGSTGSSGTYSLLSVVEHEIDEVLGLGSDVGGTGTFAAPTPEDLFRYSANGTRSYSSDCSAAAYFSLNGTADLAQFNNCNNGADYGDWASSLLPQVQDAYGTAGAYTSLTSSSVEIMALDAIGYTLTTQKVPEPASLALIGIALTSLMALRRKPKA